MSGTLDDALRAPASHARQELERYRGQVRDRAIKGFRDGWFTVDSLNDTLLELGLAPHAVSYVTHAGFSLRLNLRTDADPGEAQDLLNQLDREEILSALRLTLARVLAEQGGERFGIATADAGVHISSARRVIEHGNGSVS